MYGVSAGDSGVWPAYRVGPAYRWSLDEVLAVMRAEQDRRRVTAPTERRTT
jgi:hypothetical protein